MNLETFSLTATPKTAGERGRNVRNLQRYIAGRRETTLPVIFIFKNPYSVSCFADKNCSITIDYKEGEDQPQVEFIDTSTKLPIAGVELLEDKYIIENKTEIVTFLNKQPGLFESLVETYEQIRRIFDKNIVEVCLSISKDPEEDFTGLSLIIKTSLKSGESLNLLDKFDEEWWLDIESNIRNTVMVMVRTV